MWECCKSTVSVICQIPRLHPSSETQGQIVGATKSLNEQKNMAQRKVKDVEKSPWGQCLTRPIANGHRHFGF